jgi:hypothetical protein
MPSKGKVLVRTIPPLEKLAAEFRVDRKPQISAGVATGAAAVSRNIGKETPVKTGRLKRARRLRRFAGNQLAYEIFEIGPRALVGAYLRAGVPANKINPILPVRKKALFWPGAAHPVRMVRNHPGIAKNDYWQRGIDNSTTDLKDAMKDVAKEIEADIVAV